MTHDLPRWPRLAVAAAAVVALGAGVTASAVIVGMSDDGEAPPQGVRLVSYDSCGAALESLRERVLEHVGPYGLQYGYPGSGAPMLPAEDDVAVAAEGGAPDRGGAAPDSAPGERQDNQVAEDQAADKHSTTNVHESGVDEPDLVKTDGKRVVSIADGMLRVVDVASREQVVAVPLTGNATQLLVAGDRALVLTTPDAVMKEFAPDMSVPPVDTAFGSQLTLVDLVAGEVLGALAVDGEYLDARQVDSVARVVVRSAPRLEFAPAYGTSPTAALERNRAVVEESAIEDWLPRYSLSVGGATSSGQLVDCASVSHPEEYTGTAMLTVLTVDLNGELGIGDPVTIVADGNTVYGTGSSLYVADDHSMSGIVDGPVVHTQRTEVYQFDVSGAGKPVHVASGAVEGSLLNQYSLSEHDGHLRVATTLADERGSSSAVTVLKRNGSALEQVGRVGDLGVGERIYAVRFMGAVGYVVTFRQTDPLYTVDLSDPAKPRVTGELKIPGYSAYLHPAGDGRLIGVGQEATNTGRRMGLQVSLFDTSDATGASRLAQYHLEEAMSDVEFDPHAFLYWPETGLLVLPVTSSGAVSPDGSVMAGSALVLRLTGDTFTEVARVTHPGAAAWLAPRRALVIGAELWTVSEVGMMVSDLQTAREVAWVPFV